VAAAVVVVLVLLSSGGGGRAYPATVATLEGDLNGPRGCEYPHTEYSRLPVGPHGRPGPLSSSDPVNDHTMDFCRELGFTVHRRS
jgi:hypothetical protein